ncbi:MAG: stage III sporulation AC/AD family protein [Clostridia bacterium]|nr:stage III sporulation AC/AD family protein [Clostridia bacterium]
MGIVQIAGVALLSVALILCVRELRADLAPPTRLAAALLLFGAALALYAPVLARMQSLFSLSGAADYATPILRAAGIALICEFTASFCRDLGENTVANGVLLFGKLEILVLCVPLVDDVLEIAKELLKF